MLLKYFYDRKLAQASYLVGSETTGEALVIDPARDIMPYLKAAQDEGVRIVGVAETHIHADFVSGARELAAATGARLYLSELGGDDWRYAYTDANTILLWDGATWTVGEVRIDALHTPGHTPEHLIFQITDTAAADKPMGLFTGDCLFVANVGRPDLLETAVGVTGSAEVGARQQFGNVQKIKAMPDYLQIWPGHGAGSACGKGLGAVPTSTLGYEKLFNPAFQIDDENAFVEWLLADQPETPPYFAQMKRVNMAGPAMLSMLTQPARLSDPATLRQIMEETLVIDTRSSEAFAERHVPGTVNIPARENSFTTWAGWFVDYDVPTYVIADSMDMHSILHDLRSIGVDHVAGYFPTEIISYFSARTPQAIPQEAAQLIKDGAYLLDVRSEAEYQEAHIAGARHIHFGEVANHVDELPTDRPIVLQCASGVRSQMVFSLLERQGMNNLVNLKGGLDAWQAAGLPVEQG
jgi:hydroxyacylglutathione hydrolase